MRIPRRSRYVLLGVAVVLLGSIAFDVGHSATQSDRAADLRSVVSTVVTDLAACNSSAGDSFDAYSQVANGQHNELGAAKSLISGDEPYCTPEENTELYDLATYEVPGSLRAYDLQPAIQQLTDWAFPEAAGAITDVGTLLVKPLDAAARIDLQSRLTQMADLSRSAEGAFDRAAAALGTRIDNIDLGAPDRLRANGL